MKKFSPKTINSLKYYIYGFKYPNDDQNYFYIGKGKGNRVFSHLFQKNKKGINDPKFDVINSLKKSGGPKVDIIRHGLNEKEAFLLEATLIDVFGIDQITNKVKGINSDEFGIMDINVIDEIYKGKEFKENISAVCFKINKAWNKGMDEELLYNKIRGNWVLNINRAKRAEYGIGVYNGLIKGIYRICNWESGRSSTKNKRYKFNGYKDEKMQKYRGYSLLNYPAHKVKGPLFYYNCN